LEQRPGEDGISNTVHPGPSVAVGSSTGGPDLSRTERPGTRSSSSSTSRQAGERWNGAAPRWRPPAPDDESTILRARRRSSGSEPSEGIEDPSWDGRKRPPWGGGLHLKDRDMPRAETNKIGHLVAVPRARAVRRWRWRWRTPPRGVSGEWGLLPRAGHGLRPGCCPVCQQAS